MQVSEELTHTISLGRISGVVGQLKSTGMGFTDILRLFSWPTPNFWDEVLTLSAQKPLHAMPLFANDAMLKLNLRAKNIKSFL